MSNVSVVLYTINYNYNDLILKIRYADIKDDYNLIIESLLLCKRLL